MNFEKYSRKKKKRSVNSIPKKSANKIGVFILKSIALVILLTIVFGGFTGIGAVKAIIDSTPEIDFDSDVNPEGYATFIYDQNGNEIQKLHGTDANRIYVDYDLIPQHMIDAVVAIEDERYWDHNGIDVKGMIRAAVSNVKSGDLTGSGASTITQQIIKNNVLSSEKKFKRKIQEQYLAVKLEEAKDKEEILELYLNTAPFGRGTLGVQAAANLYFNKDVSELTIAEAAVIASITQTPTKYDPVINPENNKSRQQVVINKMYEQGFITDAEHKEALEEDVYNNIQIIYNSVERQSDFSYFVDEVIRRVHDDLTLQKGYSDTQADNLIYSGGLSIYITQDLAIQEVVDSVYTSDDYFPPEGTRESYDIKLDYRLSVKDNTGTHHYSTEELLPTMEETLARQEEIKAEWLGDSGEVLKETVYYIPQPQSAMVIMDYHTGHIKAIAGGRGKKSGNLVINRTNSLRQPGSCFKPLAAYLPAIDTKGYTLATVLDDVPFEVISPSGSWSPKNWYSHQKYNFWGLTTVREAIAWSMNICAARTLYDVGIETSWDYMLDLGFTSLVDSRIVNGNKVTDKGLSLALGGLTDGVSTLELTAAYGAIANEGVYTEPIFYTKVLDHDGAIILTKEPVTRTVMKDTTAYLLTSAMQSVVTEGTGRLAAFDGMPVAGKTGTTSDNKDVLFAGYTPYYAGAVWIGYDQPQKMKYNKAYHVAIFGKVMEEIHTDLPYKDFPKPNGIVGATICTESGKLAVPGLCDSDQRGNMTRYEIFAAGTVPRETCDVHVKGTICTESLLLPSEFCPEETLEERVFIVRPEPLVPENWNPNNPPRIRDQQYELPTEECDVHTEETVPVEDPLIDDGTGDGDSTGENPNDSTEGQTGDGNTDSDTTDDGATNTDTTTDNDSTNGTPSDTNTN